MSNAGTGRTAVEWSVLITAEIHVEDMIYEPLIIADLAAKERECRFQTDQLEGDVTEIHRLEARIAVLVKAIKARGYWRDAPCLICGYGGPGYFQPEIHPCAALTGNGDGWKPSNPDRRRSASPSDGLVSTGGRLHVRSAAKLAHPLGGADAQALEGALQQVERELAESKHALAQMRALLEGAPDCGDHGCHFSANHGGQRTNGGCRCTIQQVRDWATRLHALAASPKVQAILGDLEAEEADCAPDLVLEDREGFYEKLWKDFCSLQRGNVAGIVAEAERARRLDLALERMRARLHGLYENRFEPDKLLVQLERYEQETKMSSAASPADGLFEKMRKILGYIVGNRNITGAEEYVIVSLTPEEWRKCDALLSRLGGRSVAESIRIDGIDADFDSNGGSDE